MAKRCVIEQKLLLISCRKSYNLINRLVPKTKMNDLDLCLKPFRGCVKVASTIASHLPLNIWETVRDRGLVPKDYE